MTLDQANRVDLRIDRPQKGFEYVLVNPSETMTTKRYEVRNFRVRAQLQVFCHDLPLSVGDCMLDTGAFLAVFPHRIWSPLEKQNAIRWLKAQDGDRKAEKNAMTSGINGVAQPSKLGLIEIRFGGVDEGCPTWTKRTAIIGKFLSDTADSNLEEVLLGMEALKFQGIELPRQKNRLVVDFQEGPVGAAYLT